MGILCSRRQALRRGVALPAGLLAACGPFGAGREGPSEAVKVGGTVTAYLVTNDVVTGAQYFNDTVFGRFQKQFPSIKVAPSMAPSAQIANKTRTEIAAGVGPDVFLLHAADAPSFFARGAVLDLTEYAKRDARALADVSAALDTIKDAAQDSQGRLYSLPATLVSGALVYNRSLFDRLGVKYPDENLAWNPRDGGTFLETARKLTRPDQGIWGFWWTGQITAEQLSWLKQNNGTWLDSTRTKADMLKPASFDAFQWQHDLVHRYGVSPVPKDAPVTPPQTSAGHSLFFEGKAAMFILNLGQESSWPRDATVDLRPAPLPKGVRRAAGSLGATWNIAAYSKVPDLCWELLKWWESDFDSQVGVWTTWKWGLPPTRKTWTDARVAQPRDHPLKDVRPFLEPYEKGFAAAFEVNVAWGDYIAAYQRPFRAAMDGDLSMRTAIETAQRDVQAMLDEKLPRK